MCIASVFMVCVGVLGGLCTIIHYRRAQPVSTSRKVTRYMGQERSTAVYADFVKVILQIGHNSTSS